MLAEHPLITSLESKIYDLHRDRSTARKIVGSNSNLLTVNTAIEEYVLLKQDSTILLGIRYLALSCIAAHYQLYQDNREISQLKDLTGQAINIPTHAEVFTAIQVVKSRYHPIYDCDPREFDRMERLVKEISPNVVDEWGRNIKLAEISNIESSTEVKSIEAISTNNYNSSSTTVEGSKLQKSDYSFPSLKAHKVILFLFVCAVFVGIYNFFIKDWKINGNQPQKDPSPQKQILITPSAPYRATEEKPSQTKISPTTNKNMPPMSILSPPLEITKDDAEQLINRWYEIKKILFCMKMPAKQIAASNEYKQASELMIDAAYKKHLNLGKGMPESTIEWLSRNKSCYVYNSFNINKIRKPYRHQKGWIVQVEITEEADRIDNGVIKKEKSGSETRLVNYYIIEENQVFRIAKYWNTIASMKREV
jgi:ARC6-like, IMS domain